MMNRIAKLIERLPIEMLLILVVIASYWRVQQLWFVYDDGIYITGCSHIAHGLNLPDIKWALTSGYGANWQPLTWLSYMADTQISGMSARQFHMTNLLAHIAAMLLLFLVLNRMTKSVWKSAFVAAMFGIHPLHVESVAWISERKDVLSALFWMMTFWAYVRYAEQRDLKKYLLVMLCFALGLMSKPMIVTLPLTLLLLDYWPLRRMRVGDSSAENAIPLKKLLLEKVPLFVMTLASCAITYKVQRSGGAFGTVSNYPISIRLTNMVYSYVMYIWKTVYPAKLAVFYPHPGYHLALWKWAGAGLLLAATTAFVLRSGRKYPYLLFGWIWYVLTLIPVIGIIQVGDQGMADRYTYIPLIGLFIMLAWGIPDLLDRLSRRQVQDEARAFSPGLSAVAVVLILVLAVLTRIQVRYWRDNYTLFEHATKVVKDNYEGHLNFGSSLVLMGDRKTALREYQAAVKIHPERAPIHCSVGGVLLDLGRESEALVELHKALKIDPKYTPAIASMGTYYLKRGKLKEAMEYYEKALALDPKYTDAHNDLANVLDSLGREDEAISHYDDAIDIDPDFADPHYNKAAVLYKLGRYDEAIMEFKEAIRCKPDYAEAHKNLAVTLFGTGEYEEAWKEVYMARHYGAQVNPDFVLTLSKMMPDPYAQQAP